ncbi:MAG TPA: hypothetical protein VG817_04385 [Gemmatimonadales bacterium]|nr:hypothetical protein [Gemmatimonadales bacterium]
MSAKYASKSILAESSGRHITDTTAVTGDFMAILALSATVIASGTVSSTISGTLAGMVIPAGTIVWGRFSAIKLTSGTIIAYNNR